MQYEDNQQKKMLSIGEAADHLGVSIDTLRRWEKKGRIRSMRSPGNHRYFKVSDLDDLFGMRYARDEEINTDSDDRENEMPSLASEAIQEIHAETVPIPTDTVSSINDILPQNHQNLHEHDVVIPQIRPIAFSTPPLEPPAPPVSANYAMPEPMEPIHYSEPIRQVPVAVVQANTDSPISTSRDNLAPANQIAQFSSTQDTTDNGTKSQFELARALKEAQTQKKIPITKIVIWLVIAFTIIDLIFAYIWFSSPDIVSPLP